MLYVRWLRYIYAPSQECKQTLSFRLSGLSRISAEKCARSYTTDLAKVKVKVRSLFLENKFQVFGKNVKRRGIAWDLYLRSEGDRYSTAMLTAKPQKIESC